MKSSLLLLAKAASVPAAIATTQAAAIVLPFPVAAILGAGLCGYAGYSLCFHVWKIIDR